MNPVSPDPAGVALVCLALILIVLNIAVFARSRRMDADRQGVLSALARLDARLDEQGRRQIDHEQALRNEIGQRLSTGLERTDRAYTEVVKRLALIDKAQERMTELSSDMVSLREILADRSARGAFGEVQLGALVTNMLPPDGYEMQFTLSSGRRADCMLFLPPPTGNIAIDSKFPLSNFRRKVDHSLPDAERAGAAKAFARDVRSHIDDVAAKYILPGETCDAAVLFIPAEAVFADIHAGHPELVEHAQRKSVWLTSPTTLMAVLTTALSVLKDAATQREVHAIREHLRLLGKDFERFDSSMEKLATHIRQAGEDVARVQTSSRKITARFRRIDQLELQDPPPPPVAGAAPAEPDGGVGTSDQTPT